MSTTAIRSRDATTDAGLGKVDMKLEVVVIPVSDVGRAAEFYRRLGWRLDADIGKGDRRLLQFTPPGSPCSIIFGTGVTTYASAGDLSQALRRAEAAHGKHEARTGQRDLNWPDWYAEYMVREQSGEELPL